MVHAKYTREMLHEAVAASTSMAAVLRHLGLRQNGGAHAHLRRRITKLGIDTSHFRGSAHFRGTTSPHRRHHTEVLVMRPMDAKREKPSVLRRALEDTGRPYRCAECDLGDSWNGRPLTLHVDHIDGQFWDCRPENLRFLCPNCHGQTATHAGRNRQRAIGPFVRVDAQGNTVDPSPRAEKLSEEETIEVLARVTRKEVTVSDGARLIGCDRTHVYRLQRRLAEFGTLAPRSSCYPLPEATRAAVVDFALRHPAMGERNIASGLARQEGNSVSISPSSVRSILKAAGLTTVADRRAAAAKLEPRGTV